MKRAGLTEARLVAAAAELADESGLAAVTISALARRFAVRPASIYSHVAGLDALLDQTAALALRELADALAEVLPGKSGRAAVFAFADTHRNYARAHPDRPGVGRIPADGRRRNAGSIGMPRPPAPAAGSPARRAPS
jgi:AcrR family transcriptional regulator